MLINLHLIFILNAYQASAVGSLHSLVIRFDFRIQDILSLVAGERMCIEYWLTT